MERILILGASGLVGKALARELNNKYEVYGTFNTNNLDLIKSINFNISEPSKIIDILSTVKPLKIVYCLRGDFNLQIEVINEIIKYLKAVNGKLYFSSTANVFDGDTTKPHFESDELIAESNYGKFKIECEKILLENLGDNSIIFRLPMIWGQDSPRLNTLVTSLNNKEKVSVYTNLYLNNNSDAMLAKQIRYVIEKDLKGVFHLGSSEVINYYEFIKKIISGLGYENVEFNEEKLPEAKYYLAVLPQKEKLPKEFIFSNEDVIDSLVGI